MPEGPCQRRCRWGGLQRACQGGARNSFNAGYIWLPISIAPRLEYTLLKNAGAALRKHGPRPVNTRSTHGQHTVNTRSTHGQHTVNTRSTRKQICTFFHKKPIQNLYRGGFSGWGFLKYFLYLKCLIEAATLESSELYMIYIDSFRKTYITAYVLTVC